MLVPSPDPHFGQHAVLGSTLLGNVSNSWPFFFSLVMLTGPALLLQRSWPLHPTTREAHHQHVLLPSPTEAETRELFLEQEQLHNK